MQNRIKALLLILGREQEDLFLTPSISTPYRLLEIAEMKRVLGGLKSLGNDNDLIKGYLQGVYFKITQPKLHNAAQIQGWYKVAIYLYPKDIVEWELSDIGKRKVARSERNTPLTLKYLFQKLISNF